MVGSPNKWEVEVMVDRPSSGRRGTASSRRIRSSDKLKRLGSVKDDLVVLRSLWFQKVSGGDHAARLESFYGPQAHACA